MTTQIGCACYFCKLGYDHPIRHQTYHEISGLLTVAESLDPADVILREACVTCGHVRVKA